MKILFVTPYTPARLRPFGFIQYLSQNHEITVACISQPSFFSRDITKLRSFCKEIHTIKLNRYSCYVKGTLAITSKRPMSVAYFSSNSMKSLVERLVESKKFDLIHTEFIRAAQYTALIQGVPKLFDSVDSLTLAYKRGWQNKYGSVFNRLIALEEWLKMREYERNTIHLFDRVTVSSPVDKKYLTSSNGPFVDILPNGVDRNYFYWDNKKRDEKSIVFVGAMNYYVNHDSILHFTHSIFPIIQKLYPKVHFTIVGADPKASVRHLSKHSSIEVTGYVPDIRPYLSRASVFVCPLFAGSGIQNKLLQAMAMGTPIVTTSIAIQALQVKNEEQVLVADQPNEFAEAVVRLMKNIDTQKRLSVNARWYIEEHHDWGKIGKKLERIYENMCY